MSQRVHPKTTARRPKIIQIQAVEWDGNPTLIALFDDGQLMQGYFTSDGAGLTWCDLPTPIPSRRG